MIGLIALLFFVLWGFIAYKLSKFLTKKMKAENPRKIAIPILSVLIFFVPVADEIIGGIQFRLLCNREALVADYDENSMGRKLVSVGAVSYELREYTLPITKLHFSYEDIDSKEIMISWNYFKAKGGFVARSLNIFGSDAPYTFNGVCAPEVSGSEIFKRLNVEVQYK
ncbi:MAG: hypothetical protein Q7T74_05790 [Candidatus Saccharibacteria bacterium]|nr:hypothetical protein [Candidatus Saccharibacteria bacterium]